MRTGKDHAAFLKGESGSYLQQARARDLRFEQRHNYDQLIKMIVSGDIVDMFMRGGGGHGKFVKVPDSFPNGHAEYLRVWEKLFLYETFNSIVNSKRGIEDIPAGSTRR